MSDRGMQQGESLSALMDGEASEIEFHRILKDLSQDDDARARWQRYHLISTSLRQEECAEPNLDLCSSIQQAIEQEDAHSVSLISRIWQPLSRFAVAASVAALAVVGVQQYSQVGGDEATAIAGGNSSVQQAELAPVQFPSSFSVPRVPVRTVSATSTPEYASTRPVVLLRKVDAVDSANQQKVERYLNEMMRRHAENSALNGTQGMLPYARMPSTANSEKN